MPKNPGPGLFFEKISKFIYRTRYLIVLVLLGTILIGLGFLVSKSKGFSSDKVEILTDQNAPLEKQGEVVVEIAGAVISPGVYKLPQDSRVEDLLIASGGISSAADRVWVEKNINRAAKLTDSQKIYIPTSEETADYQSGVLGAKNSGEYQTVSGDFSVRGSGLININTASQNQLESLPGIGPVYAQKIIEQRPYSTTQEMVTKGAIGQTLYEKIKNDITVY